jgi:peptidoglycan-associated lipoprotein
MSRFFRYSGERSNSLDRRKHVFIYATLFVTLISVTGCKKKIAAPPAPPPPAAPAPTAQITATPAVITIGDTVELSWSTTNATIVTLEGYGTVFPVGTKSITPGSSITYHLTANGSGGSADASVRVTVNELPAEPTPPPPVVAPVSTISPEEEFKANVHDIFFDYDEYNLSPDAKTELSKDASYFTTHPSVKILIGGYCDERGSAEYNIALGQNRAAATEKALVDAGVDASRIRVISYGKEKPFCTESNEACYQKNRRAAFSLDH